MTDCISIEIALLSLNVCFIKDDLFHWSFKSVQIKAQPLLHVAQNVALEISQQQVKWNKIVIPVWNQNKSLLL